MQRGWILLDQHRYAEAEAELAQALAGDVDKVQGLYWLGWAQFSQGKFTEAEGTIARCLAENPTRPEGYHARAVLKRKQNELASAEEACRIAVEKDPWTVEYRAELAWILLYRLRPADALEAADSGLKDQPQSVELHRARTQAFIDLGELDKAEESARQALGIAPQDPTSRRQLGSIAFRRKDYDEAVKQYTETLRLDPGYTYARTALLNALRHRIWYYRLLVPSNVSTVGRRRNAWVFAAIAAAAAVRAIPAGEAGLGVVLLLGMAAALVRWYLGATVGPVTTLLLRMNPMARAVLPADEMECAVFTGALMFGALVFLMAAIFGAWHGFFAIGLFLMLMVVPLTKTYEAPKGYKRTVAECCAWLVFTLGCGGVATMAQGMYEIATMLFVFCFSGSLAFEGMARTLGDALGAFRKE